ncbi:MAG: ribonuclease T [Gammaproteobacteria bacterium]|nr:ribonuclease T [Gammaproteobacteria bacterium]
MLAKQKKITWANRFRGFLPIVIDVETSGLEPATDALLEIAAVTLAMDDNGKLSRDKTYVYQVEPFQNARMDPKALEITGIEPFHPFRYAIPEQQALHRIFTKIQCLLAATQCQRAVLVGHNAWFDLSFIQAAVKRANLTSNPFHSFTTFDTACLAAVALGETVLARSVRRANMSFDISKAHSASYDAEKTAELFCYIVNNSFFKI